MIPLRSTLKLVQPATALPVASDDVKGDLGYNANDTAVDSKVDSLILAATAYVSGPDGVLGKALISQTWSVSVPCAGRNGRIEIPLTPVQSVKSIKYFDPEGNEQTLTVDNFHLFGDEDRAYIEPKSGTVWPGVYDRPDAITITFVAGFGDSAEFVPENVKQAIRLLCCHWFENREAVVVGTPPSALPMGVEALLGVSRTGWVG